MYVVAATAGALVVADHLGGAGTTHGSTHGSMHGGHHAAHGVPLEEGVTVGAAAGHWTLMVLAMMLPMAAPQARLVALRSVWVRRHRAAVVFALGYVAVWSAVGLPVVVAVAASPVAPPAWLGPTLLGLAALWQVSPWRRRTLRRCGAVRLGSPRGSSADRNCLDVGARAGGVCVVGCGPAMLPMAVQPMAPWSLPVMAGVLVVMLAERASGPDPARRMGRRGPAVALAGIAVAAALVPAT
jgi:predicted metal-binding membrane protein